VTCGNLEVTRVTRRSPSHVRITSPRRHVPHAVSVCLGEASAKAVIVNPGRMRTGGINSRRQTRLRIRHLRHHSLLVSDGIVPLSGHSRRIPDIHPARHPRYRRWAAHHPSAPLNRRQHFAAPGSIGLHRFSAEQIFYPNFYPSRPPGGASGTTSLAGGGFHAREHVGCGSSFQAGHAGSIPVIRSYSSQLILFIRLSFLCFCGTQLTRVPVAWWPRPCGADRFPGADVAVSASSLPMSAGQDAATAFASTPPRLLRSPLSWAREPISGRSTRPGQPAGHRRT
jgi:hypothetical protein